MIQAEIFDRYGQTYDLRDFIKKIKSLVNKLFLLILQLILKHTVVQEI